MKIKYEDLSLEEVARTGSYNQNREYLIRVVIHGERPHALALEDCLNKHMPRKEKEE